MAQSAEAIRAYASLLVQATIPLVLGSFKSLKVSKRKSFEIALTTRLQNLQNVFEPLD